MKMWLWLIVALMLAGCAGSFQADTEYPVDASLQIGELQQISTDAGVLFDWFWTNNAFSEAEGKVILGYYTDMVRIMEKVRNEAIAGVIDYHRLNIRVGDLTDAWKLLKPELQSQIDIVASDGSSGRLEDRLAIAMWNTLSGDMDNILSSTNIALANARNDMSEATYDAFKKDVKGIMSTFSPMIKMGLGRFGI